MTKNANGWLYGDVKRRPAVSCSAKDDETVFKRVTVTVRLTADAHEAIKTLPLWVNRCRFLAQVIYGDDREVVSLSHSLASSQPRSSVILRSHKVIAAVKRVREMEL